MARVAVYTITHNNTLPRHELTKKSFKWLRSMAGIEFDHYVADNGSIPETQEWLEGEYAEGRIHRYYPSDENLGQNIAANILLDWITEGDYDWVLRWDNDAIPRTRRFLKKLVRCGDVFRRENVNPILSPKITKLQNPPPPLMETGDDIGFQYEPVAILGGICRLHPFFFFVDWRFNKFGALGLGEAKEAADRANNLNMPKIRLPEIRVEHADGQKGQEKNDPQHFSFANWEVGRYVGYGL